MSMMSAVRSWVGYVGLGGAVIACGAPGQAWDGQQRSELGTGTTYHVAPHGSDSAQGTRDQPFRTIQRGIDAASAGDTILVAPGTYAGARIGKSGTATAPLTLKAETSEKPVVDRPGPRNRVSSIIEIESFSERVAHVVVDGFELINAPRSGIDIRNADHITVRNSYVHHNGTNGRATGIFLAFSNHPVIERNESAYNSEHGVYQSNSGDYPIIRENRIHHNRMCGVHLNGDINYGGDGVISYARIERNVIWENGVGGGSAINMDGASDSFVANNLLYENHASGVSLYRIDGAEASSRNRLVHNTIVQATGSRWCINMPGGTGNQLYNNILIHPDSSRGAISVYSGAAQNGFRSNHNVVVNRFSANQSSVISLASWQGLGLDQNSVLYSGGSLFVDTGQADYKLSSTSPALDKGVVIEDVSDDLEGALRPAGSGVDIGCYEAGGIVPPPPSPPPAPPPGANEGGCTSVSAGSAIRVLPIAEQPGQFEIVWTLTPTSAPMDAAGGLAASQPSSWTDLAAIVRFGPSGRIDVRDGGIYRADVALPYVANTAYAITMSVDVPNGRYSVTVGANGKRYELAKDYGFRLEQAGVPHLAQVALISASGTLGACSLAVQTPALLRD